MNEQLVILNMLKNLRKRLNIILVITCLSVGVVWCLVEYVITPNYEATAQILIDDLAKENLEGSSVPSDPDPQMVDAYRVIIKSPDVLNEVIRALKLDYSVSDLRNNMMVTNASNAAVLNITVSNEDAQMAASIANSITAVLQDELLNIETENVTVISNASEESAFSLMKENMIFILGIAGAFGLIVGILVAFIIEMLSTVFKTTARGRKKKEAKLQTVFK
ncbi:YveK family protein [Planococcus sp. YIM B11945]|uniref:YveK family protein n=1 Tax=Planococcus sp. YIM B11945 TaxID=3435410 RepID=UPI003D7D2F86